MGKNARGRYIDKVVDIIVLNELGQPISGIAFKFVMSNYKQNSNNYFENMLGETANIRCRNIPYFQILVLIEEVPYYSNSGHIKKFEKLSENDLKKYIILSGDPADVFFQTPSRTLLYITKLPPPTRDIVDRKKYRDYYMNKELLLSDSFNGIFKDGVILNNYERFLKKTVHYIKSLGS